ncbi:MAG: phosphoribosyl 1,2-cyclic phosphate phosphodiesterase [Motiliproteus sp.]|jgi:phosphoribosyl 1,2-cyclic phosphate phosphodiesterase
MFEITFTGTGNAGQVPVWGCRCRACIRAVADPSHRRRPCSLAIRTPLGITLIDAGRTDLAERYAFDDIHRIVLTHFHMDHVQGLFHLRWSERPEKIPVFRPDDPVGADDLYKHPGVLAFQPPLVPFEPVIWEDFSITPLPLEHSKITLGYLLETDGFRVAYLTDTAGLPDDTAAFLSNLSPDTLPAGTLPTCTLPKGSLPAGTLDYLIIDCSEPPRAIPPKNHNDVTRVLEIYRQLQPKKMVLTHISHRLDCWLLDSPQTLPDNVIIARDDMVISAPSFYQKKIR